MNTSSFDGEPSGNTPPRAGRAVNSSSLRSVGTLFAHRTSFILAPYQKQPGPKDGRSAGAIEGITSGNPKLALGGD